MHIIELTELQFRNYSNRHSRKNYHQSVEYAKLKQDNDYYPIYVGLIDDMNNVHAASLILAKKINNKHRYGYIPSGYLINFYNLDLLKTFTIELKSYLKKLNFIYVRINPLINYQVYNSDFILKENNSGMINELKKLEYDYIPNSSKYKMILKATNIEATYKNFKRSLRRNINNCLKKGIIVYQGTEKDKQDFLNLVENKKRYQKMMELFHTPDNNFEFYLAKIDPQTYINNYRYLVKKEQINNEIINGTVLFKNYPNGVVIAGVAVITNKREVTFVKECYNNEFKHIRSIPMIKWEIIKKYIMSGYHKFDLGNIVIAKNQITKTGYNGNIIEYSNSFDLVINDLLYKLNEFGKKINKNDK